MNTNLIAGVVTGNAQREGGERRGWFIGDFITPPDDPRSTSDIEVKWGIHAAGDKRSDWTEPATVTTISILISGRFCLQFPDGEIVLSSQGDYVLWLPGVTHSWHAEEASVVLTVRWPSQSS
ncbi:signal peptidase I [Oscillatoria sp. FACHB-1407]|uniref:signal peptidase I n=1 Tax=Oscillatoria sp. FACHB-1407 TaxID=2692847 RepID=UPI0016847FA4|nr:signal peptidase I [Oscillatoria sp. FACHB-1407]MBD2459564.1 signal peptidase I [Oscillatoria sp. FACHB-1407]